MPHPQPHFFHATITNTPGTPYISAVGGTLSLVAGTVNVNGVDLVSWIQALQARLQVCCEPHHPH
jgi:hypothetical protein